MSIQTVKIQGNGYLVNSIHNVAFDPSGHWYKAVQKWIADGNTPEPAETASEILTRKRKEKSKEIRSLIISRCKDRVTALDSQPMIELLAELWPMLDQTKATADITACKDIVVYGRTKLNQIKTATEVQVDNYDPSTDPSFPL